LEPREPFRTSISSILPLLVNFHPDLSDDAVDNLGD
jgi:hypothetical protein